FGRMGVPGPASGSLSAAHLTELIHDAAGKGLADRTFRRFFSAGSLPSSDAPLPSGVELGSQPAGYSFSAEVPHLFAYQREPGRTVDRLDERCHQDYAKTLLPEIGRVVVAALDLLFRGKLEIAESDGRLEVRPAEVPLGKGRVTLFYDGADGR